MEHQKHQYDLLIKEFHLDTFGHVNNATYLQLLEEARWEMITSRGFGLKEIQATGYGPIILDLKLRFKKEIRLRQKIRIETDLVSCERKIATIAQIILDEVGDICCKAEFKFGLFDLKKRQLISPTKEWLYAIGFR